MKLTNEAIEYMLKDPDFYDEKLLHISASNIKEKLSEILQLRKESESKTQRIMQFDSAITEIGAYIQKSVPSFTMCGVDTGDSQKKIIEYIKSLESQIEALCNDSDEGVEE